MRRGLAAGLVAALSTVLALAWAATPAHAHATLVGSTPPDGASVGQPPAEVLLTFNEAPDPVLSAVRVLDASGAEVEASEAEPVAGQPARLRVALGPLAEGTYTVSWRVTSVVDGHTTVGSVAFGVAVPAIAAADDRAQAAVEIPAPTATSVVGRWLFYVAVVLLVGAGIVGAAVVSNPRAVPPRLLGAAWAAGVAGLVLTAADYRASARISLSALLSSPTGEKLTLQALAMVLVGALALWAARRPSRASLGAVGVGAAAAMLARALAGHANGSSQRGFAVGVQWVHLVSVGVWVGGLVWLLVAMRRGDPGRGPGLLRRYSSMASVALGVVVVSGTLRALDEVGGWTGLFDTSFGTALLVKVGLVAALVALGALSRFRYVRPPAVPRRAGPRRAGLRRLVRGEVGIAVGVLAVTAVLTGLAPADSLATASDPSPALGVTVTGHDYGTSVRVQLQVTPGTAGLNRFDASVVDYDSGLPVPADAVSLRFQLPARPQLAVTTLDLTPGPDDRWQGSGSALSIEGRWLVTAVVETPTAAVEVPMELVTAGSGAPGNTVPDGTCGNGTADPSYQVAMVSEPDPARAEGTSFIFSVQRDGVPVTGAQVCLEVDMPSMQHRGVDAVATQAGEAGEGRYRAELQFPMVGGWAGSVTVVEPGRPPVVVPVEFEVT